MSNPPLDESESVCPYCGQKGSFAFLFYSRNYFRCPVCDLIYLAGIPDERQSDRLAYFRDKYFNDYAGDQPAREGAHLNSRILDVIEKRCCKGRLLDIGCGCGFFLKTAKDRGWDVAGIDPSIQSIAMARELLGDVVSVGTVHDVASVVPFDVVTFINVIAQLRDSWRDVSRARELLRTGGCLYLRFSNGLFHSAITRIQAAITDKAVINHMLVFHEYAFTPAFIRKFLDDQGFESIIISNAQICGAALYRHSSVLKNLFSGLRFFLSLFVSTCDRISSHRWLLGPSLEVTAVKKV